MKQKFNYLLLLMFSMLFAVSCSQSDELLLPEEASVNLRADSPLLIATPTQIYFNNVNVGSSVEKVVNIKTAGLSSLAALTGFDVMIQGADENQFIVEDVSLSLVQLLQALLGNGIDIPVTYFPTEEGPHEAELLVTAALLNVVMSVQTTVPLHGTTQVGVGPQLVSTVPANGGSTIFDSRVPGVIGTPKGQYHIDFVFNENIILTPDFALQYPNVTGAAIQSYSLVNGNTLRVVVWEGAVSASVQHQLNILPGSIASTSNVRNNQTISLLYNVTGGIPQ